MALVNKANDEQILSRFNGENDLLDVCNRFYYSLKNNKIEYFDNQGSKRVFSLNASIDFLRTDRVLVTKFNSAYTGDEFDVRNAVTSRLLHKVKTDELQTRSLFSLCHIPKNSKYGYIVFENKANHGAKVIFERGFQAFFKVSGYEDYKVVMTPALNYNYLSNFINNGVLKKVRLIDNILKKDIQLALWDEVLTICSDNEVRELNFKKKSASEIAMVKKELFQMFFSSLNKYDKLCFINQYEVDDISFLINYNGESKTFYMKDRSRMRAIIDVSNQLMYADGNPTYNSMVKASLNLIDEILGVDSLGIDIAA
ncbi:hypothetical protein [Algibacter pacificus]|uniref:hypothetical protein n=1 Tax=Algibacter pacificus TaxID=2599389 RepID=UPI0011CB6380|nr:hypothetical protein [Algibacter pacificus]